MSDSNRLSGSEKDSLRKKFGHNNLTGSEKDHGRKVKSKALDKAKGHKFKVDTGRNTFHFDTKKNADNFKKGLTN